MKKYNIIAPHKCGSSIINRIINSINELKPGHLYFSRFPNEYVNCPENSFIFVVRNPLAICISAFYSFGYTHGVPRHRTAEEHKLIQKEIRKLGLSSFIEQRMPEHEGKIRNIFNLKGDNKLILPYELMIADFGRFLKKILNYINSPELFDQLYQRWHSSFTPINDQTKLIVNNKLKTHKRTTDIHEWKKKIPSEDLAKYITEYPFILEYDKFLQKLL